MTRLSSSFLRAIKVDIVMILVTGSSFLALYFVFAIRSTLLGYSERYFYFETAEGTYKQAYASPNPRHNDSKALAFVERVIGDCFSIDVTTAQKISDGDSDNRLSKCIQSNLLPLAATSLFSLYPSDNLIDVILSAEAQAYAVTPYQPAIVSRNAPSAPLRWTILAPVTVTIQSLSTDQTSSFLLEFTIVPDASAPNPSNLIISQVRFL
ncbi:hypothetical protein BOO92_13760 [Vibrio navarrensis]|uniref:DotI/IcmL/TraM family protein n=1 Tax=Vibrio navarrensis TaxID=29495 RepID=UPI0018683AA1|nr:hypothetical protein [Vibrio navarrensis]MBE3657743.1 hypothetical protein [Vibrio navarrensis]